MVNNPSTVTVHEMRYLLDMSTAATRRKFTNEECSLWHDLLRKYSYDACYEAFKSVLSTQTDFLTPALIRQEILKLRKKRIESNQGYIDSRIPSGLDGPGYLALLQERIQEVAQPPKAPAVPQATVIERPVPKQLNS